MATPAAPASSSSISSWSALPLDVLVKIASLHSFIVDLFSFRSVCWSWRSASLEAAAHGLLSRLPSPFLMFHDEADPFTRRFYSVRNGKAYRLRFPDDSRGWRCCGSAHGWLAILGSDVSACLFHPFSGARIELPPLTTLPAVKVRGDGAFDLETPISIIAGLRTIMTVGAEVLRDVYVDKAILGMDPSSDPGSVVVLLLLHDLAGLVYARPGDEAWTALPTPQVHFFKDVVYHGGLFYGLAYDGEMLVSIDLFSGNCPVVKKLAEPSEWTFCQTCYLVVLPSGVFLLVRRRTDHESDPRKTNFLQVLRLNQDRNPKKWVEVKALRGISLFLDGTCSAGLYTSGVEGKCRSNCIYFAHDGRCSPGYDESFGDKLQISDHDFGLFRLRDKGFELDFPPEVGETVKRPVWVWLSN